MPRSSLGLPLAGPHPLSRGAIPLLCLFLTFMDMEPLPRSFHTLAVCSLYEMGLSCHVMGVGGGEGVCL